MQCKLTFVRLKHHPDREKQKTGGLHVSFKSRHFGCIRLDEIYVIKMTSLHSVKLATHFDERSKIDVAMQLLYAYATRSCERALNLSVNSSLFIFLKQKVKSQ